MAIEVTKLIIISELLKNKFATVLGKFSATFSTNATIHVH